MIPIVRLMCVYIEEKRHNTIKKVVIHTNH